MKKFSLNDITERLSDIFEGVEFETSQGVLSLRHILNLPVEDRQLVQQALTDIQVLSGSQEQEDVTALDAILRDMVGILSEGGDDVVEALPITELIVITQMWAEAVAPGEA